jgi:hypothetical protein
MTSRVLILGCSATKAKGPILMPAWQRYDGPMWRTFRQYWDRERHEVWVLSAYHGLIRCTTKIELYEQGLDDPDAYSDWRGTAKEKLLRFPVFVGDPLRKLLARDIELTVMLGEGYRNVIGQWELVLTQAGPSTAKVRYVTRLAIGEQRVALRHWFEEHVPA